MTLRTGIHDDGDAPTRQQSWASTTRGPWVQLEMRVLTYVVAALLTLVVMLGAFEMTMGYGLTEVGHSPQPDQGPVL